MRTARAAKDGSYTLQPLPAGEYYVVAVQEDQVGDWQDPALLQALSRVATTIRLLDGEQKTQNLDGRRASDDEVLRVLTVRAGAKGAVLRVLHVPPVLGVLMVLGAFRHRGFRRRRAMRADRCAARR